MRYIKYILISLLLVLLTGCTATYNLDIDKDNNIKETVILKETYDVLFTYTTSPSEYVTSELDSVKNEGTYNSYDIKSYVEDNFGYGVGEKTYFNFENYKNNSIIISEMFEDISVYKEDSIVTILMKPKDEFIYFEENSEYSALLDKVDIKINLPFKVTQSNADNTNENEYTWTIKKDGSLKEIQISYDISKLNTKPISITTWIIIGMVGFLLVISLYIYIRYKMSSRY